MPPKPFKPPRPAASSEPAPKSRPKTKASTTSARKSTTPKANPNGVSKSKPKQSKIVNGKDKHPPRISAASRLSFAGLPSLSPDSDDENETDGAANSARRGRGGNNDEEEDAAEISSISLSSDEPSLPAPKRRQSASKAKSKSQNPPDDAVSPDPEAENAIPLDLLNVLLHQFYKEDNTRMSKDANKAVGKYMETFVREALARVTYAKSGKEEGEGAGGETLEVEDLEKVAPQMLLDF